MFIILLLHEEPKEAKIKEKEIIHQTNEYLLGLLHGETDGLDWRELVLRLLSGLLREHTLSMDTVVFLHASHTHSSLHLQTEAQLDFKICIYSI